MEAERKLALKMKGLSQGELGSRWNRSQPFVSQLLSGKSRSLEYERDFAKLVGRKHADLFPPHRDGKRPKLKRRPQRSSRD
jgi:hypothetical protein